MAKRKRLTPARGLELSPGGALPEEARFARETSGTKAALASPLPPIASMAGDVSRRAALDEMAATLEAARAEGRLAEALPLDAIVEDHLIRDRAVIDETEMDALTESLRARGQQVPVEVTDLGGGRYGLISGWRRLTALRRLAAEGQGPGTVAAFLRRPDGDAAAYLAMVEENEIRADLGFWERGRIVWRAVEAGVFETVKEALNGLFGSVPRARRSKIGSFALLARHLDGALRFPQALTERTGLALSQRLKAAEETGPDAVATLTGTLRAAVAREDPATPEAEATVLQAFLSGGSQSDRARGGRPRKTAAPARRAPRSVPPNGPDLVPGLRIAAAAEGDALALTLSGPRVDAEFRRKLEAWLRETLDG